MKKSNRQIFFPFYLIIAILIVFFSSCGSLKPVVQNDSLQTLTENDLSKFNGDYEIFSTDTSFRTSSFALTYKDEFNLQNLSKANDRLSLQAIDSRRIKVTVFKNDKAVRTKIIKGKVSQEYFHFKLTHISFYFIINGYGTQKIELDCLKVVI